MGTELLLQALFPFSHLYQRLMAQLMHVSSTGSLSLVMFSAPRVTSQQEVLWYGLYATVLWFTVAVVVRIFGKRFTPLETDAVLDAFYNGYLRPRRSMTLM